MYLKIDVKIKFRDFGIDLGHTEQKISNRNSYCRVDRGICSRRGIVSSYRGQKGFHKGNQI